MALLNPDYRNIRSAFNDAKVDYLLAEAYALAAHGPLRLASQAIVGADLAKSVLIAEC